MSQFMLAVGDPSGVEQVVGLQVVGIAAADHLLLDAANALFGSIQSKACWFVQDQQTHCTDTLFTETQRALVEDHTFKQTRLILLLTHLLEQVQDLVLWYGDDWSMLPCITDKDQFIAIIVKQLRESSGEVYVRFHYYLGG